MNFESTADKIKTIHNFLGQAPDIEDVKNTIKETYKKSGKLENIDEDKLDKISTALAAITDSLSRKSGQSVNEIAEKYLPSVAQLNGYVYADEDGNGITGDDIKNTIDNLKQNIGNLYNDETQDNTDTISQILSDIELLENMQDGNLPDEHQQRALNLITTYNQKTDNAEVHHQSADNEGVNDNKTVTPVNIDGDSVPNLNKVSDLKKWIYENLPLLGTITIKSENRNVQFSKKAIDRSLKGIYRYPVKRNSYAGLKELVENSIFGGEIKADDKHKDKVTGQELYYNALTYNGETYGVKISVDIPKQKNTPYTYAGHKIEIMKAPAASEVGSNELTFVRPEATISINDIKKLFNPDVKNGNTYFQSAETAGAENNRTAIAKKEWQEKGINSRFFKKWFGNSKVVDENGEPLVVYHNTNNEFDTFDRNFDETASGRGVYGGGFNFTSYPDYANDFGKRQIKAYVKIEKPFDMSKTDTKKFIEEIYKLHYGNDYKNYMKGTNNWTGYIDSKVQSPYMLLEYLQGQQYKGKIKIPEFLKSLGFDGIKDGHIWVAFSPEQIKSVDNQGTFDNNNPNIYYQGESNQLNINPAVNKVRKLRLVKGGYIPAGKFIELYKNADPSTIIHEVGHWWLNTLTDMEKNGNDEITQDMAEIRKYLKNDGSPFTEEQHEKFARGFENYIRTGNARSNRLKKIFEDFKNFLLSIYDNIKNIGTDDETPELVKLFDQLLTTEHERIQKTVFDKCIEIDERIQKIKNDEQQEIDYIYDLHKNSVSYAQAQEKLKNRVNELLKTAENKSSQLPKEVKEWQKRFKAATYAILETATGMDIKQIANPKNEKKVRRLIETTDKITASGGKIGSNLYELSDIQDFDSEGLYDLPPLPIDTYKEINYSDTYDKEKHYFVVQDSPLPLHITSVIPHYKHVPRT